MKRKVNDAYVRSKTRLDKIINKLNSLGISYNIKESGPWYVFKVAGDDKAYTIHIRGKVNGYVTINTDKVGSITVRLNANSGKLLVDKLCSTVEQAISEIVNALSLVTDSLQLKTYKIKNHDSGKTYRVKAVSYTDAVNRYNKHILKDSWSSYRFKTGPQSDEFKRYLRSRRIYFEPSQDGAYTHFEVKNADKEVDRKANEIAKQIKDALTEDATVTYIENYKGVKIYQNDDNKKYFATVYRYSLEDKDLKTLKAKIDEALNAHIKKYKNLDSLTEDADDITYKGYLILAEYQLGSKNIAQYKIYEPNGDYLFSVKTVEQAKKVVDNEVKHRMNDADIAQNDIKSTYLPEDANADNIRYLGFNEKRKLSFYSYGDRYFVYHDLEGRTEEIDKETVQKILKKNILGEIDENDLINKEPQSEEIVSDAFDWQTKQERGNR